MSNPEEQYKIPIQWAATILTTVAGLIFQTGIFYSRVHDLELKVEESKEYNRGQDRLNIEQGLRLQKLEITLTNISDKLDEIAKKLDKR